MKKTKPTKEVKAVKKKIAQKITQMTVDAIKRNKIIKLSYMIESFPFESFTGAKITVWFNLFGDLTVLVPFTKTTVKTIGGMFNPHEIRKEETFCLVYIIDIIERLNDPISSEVNEIKKNDLEKRGIIYLQGSDINDLYEQVISNQ